MEQIGIKEFQPLPSLTVNSQVGKAIGGMSKSKPNNSKCYGGLKPKLKANGKYVVGG